MKKEQHFNAIAQAIQYIRDHYSEQPTLEKIAAAVHISPYHFQRLFQKWAGLSPKQFLQYVTLEQAKKSLEQGRSTLNTAYEVGLSGNGRLHDLFLKIEACSPGDFKKRGQGLQIQFARISTPFGPALIAETAKGICQLAFREENEEDQSFLNDLYPLAQLIPDLGPNGIRAQYFFQTWKAPDQEIKIDLRGTPFQIQVWKALLQIPNAQCLSYQDIAQQIDRPKAMRAVGTAIGKNPIAYLIPCHRVIRQSGELGGYRWRPERKSAIHAYELAHKNKP